MMPANEPWRITVDGEAFEIRQPDGKPGSYDLTWLTGPDPQYGFGFSTHPPAQSSRTHLEDAIREFLSQVDPDTGHIM
ncbi:hypothetical protein [Streptomyces sp. 3214.6]|uniref:hypothetical protein n=1 Tax=Streptomyces sp. 3214.6 TaxID=1882757 RepID=UPI0009095617|nr:hypothetical protein [Streptomyces sp. 3214.6]SHH41278.1 hypothetical protein SAMN05444521_0432 [Streptomyces sp. 3214.6]